MKVINEKHDVILNVYLSAESKVKDGDLVSHKQTVQNGTFFYSTKPGRYIHINLSKDMILDLARQIKEIESSVIVKPFESELPY